MKKNNEIKMPGEKDILNNVPIFKTAVSANLMSSLPISILTQVILQHKIK